MPASRAVTIAAAALAAACGAGARGDAVSIHHISTSDAGAHEVSLAPIGSGLMAAWYDTRAGHAEIYARALDAAGRPAGPELRLVSGQAEAYEADLQPIDGGFVVGWYEKDGAGRLTPYVGAWSRDGVRRWAMPLAEAGRNVVVRTAGGRIFAAWLVDEAGGRAGLWAGWWSAEGNVVAAPARLATAGRTTWNLNAAVDPASSTREPRAWIVFDAAAGTRAEELFIVESRICQGGPARDARAPAVATRACAGEAGVRQLTPDDGLASKYPDLALEGSRAAVTWYDQRDGNAEVYLWVGALGQLAESISGAARRVTATDGESIGAYVAWNAGRVGLAWCDDSEGNDEVYFAAFDGSGAPLGPARRLTETPADSLIPAIRPWRSGFALAWNEYEAPANDGHTAGGRSFIAATIVP